MYSDADSNYVMQVYGLAHLLVFVVVLITIAVLMSSFYSIFMLLYVICILHTRMHLHHNQIAVVLPFSMVAAMWLL